MDVLHDLEWTIPGESWNSIDIFYSVENQDMPSLRDVAQRYFVYIQW